MDSGAPALKRDRYLQLLGIERWQLRDRDAAAGEAPAEPADEAPVSAPAMVAAAAVPPVPPAPVSPPAPPARPAVAAAAPRPAPVPAGPVPQDWEGLRAAVAGCERCKLCSTRTNTVFGVGETAAPLMIVGEGPGADEDAQGEPFVGRAGKLLDEMLRAIGRSRREPQGDKAVFIANVVKCRPPGNRDPQPDEVEACRPYLDAQIKLVRPRLIVALGRVAAQRLLDTDAPLSKLRGPLYRYGETQTPVFVTYHPAYLLRSPGEKAKSWQDLKRVHQLLREL